jgi:hypothetical protein
MDRTVPLRQEFRESEEVGDLFRATLRRQGDRRLNHLPVFSQTNSGTKYHALTRGTKVDDYFACDKENELAFFGEYILLGRG